MKASVFNRLKGTKDKADCWYGDSRVRAVVESASNGDTGVVRDALAEPDEDWRALVARSVGNRLSVETARRMAEDRPDDPAGWLVLGCALVAHGRRTRGGATAANTSTGKLLDFEEAMDDARRALTRAAELAPADPTPWANILVTDYNGHGDIPADLGELRRRSPFHTIGLWVTADLLGQKWFGDDGEARRLADVLLAEAPRGDESAVVAAVAFREEWLYKRWFEDDYSASDALVQDETNQRWLTNALDHSLRAAEHRPTAVTPIVRNEFAFAFHIAGMREEAGEQLALLDGQVTESPWTYLGRPTRAFAKARRAAGV